MLPENAQALHEMRLRKARPNGCVVVTDDRDDVMPRAGALGSYCLVVSQDVEQYDFSTLYGLSVLMVLKHCDHRRAVAFTKQIEAAKPRSLLVKFPWMDGSEWAVLPEELREPEDA